jgi:hypothetical protein
MEQITLEQVMELLKAFEDRMMAKMDAWLEKTDACLEKEEPAPEEPKAVAETEEVPEGATDEEAIGVTEDRSRNLRLAVGCRGPNVMVGWGKCLPPPSDGRPVV